MWIIGSSTRSIKHNIFKVRVLYTNCGPWFLLSIRHCTYLHMDQFNMLTRPLNSTGIGSTTSIATVHRAHSSINCLPTTHISTSSSSMVHNDSNSPHNNSLTTNNKSHTQPLSNHTPISLGGSKRYPITASLTCFLVYILLAWTWLQWYLLWSELTSCMKVLLRIITMNY